MTERPSNAPYEPQYFAAITEEWARLLALFLKFCERITIQSKDEGPVRLILRPPQRFLIECVFLGFSLGIHDFVILKSRQLGASTVLWAFDLFWLTKFSLQGMYIADDEPNKEVHRDILQEMYGSLPPSYTRGPARVANRLELAWNDTKTWRASRLMWAFANRQKTGQLGRSRGANYLHCEELDSWGDPDALGALDSAKSSVHPRRAYFYVGTGQGYSILYSLWEQAQTSKTSRAIFLGWWRDPARIVTRAERALWAAYGQPRPTDEEQEWIEEVRRREGHKITRDQLAWWRKELAEGKGINGNLAKMMQEHPWFPEQAFQAAGSQFLSPMTCLTLRRNLERAPEPECYRYAWGQHFDAKDDPLEPVDDDHATLRIWEPCQPGGVYVLAGDPAYGSGPDADRYAATVWRAHPDAMVQVASYATPEGAMYQYAWVLAHLAGNYRIDNDDHLILEIGGPGRAVHEELERMANYAYGFVSSSVRVMTIEERQRFTKCSECSQTPRLMNARTDKPICDRCAAALRKPRDDVRSVLASVNHFLYRRVDSITGQQAWHFNTTAENRLQIFEQLRDTVERGALIVRDRQLAEELAGLRRDEDSSRIEAGGILHDDIAFTAALAVHCWLQNVVPEIEDTVAPLTPPRDQPANVGEAMLRRFVRAHERPEASGDGPVPYGLNRVGPGRGRR